MTSGADYGSAGTYTTSEDMCAPPLPPPLMRGGFGLFRQFVWLSFLGAPSRRYASRARVARARVAGRWAGGALAARCAAGCERCSLERRKHGVSRRSL